MEEKQLKEVALNTLNNFESVTSLACFVSNEDRSSVLIASKDRRDLQNILVKAMIEDSSVCALFKGAIMAAELFK